MEKYERSNTPTSPEYDMYTAEYISALFTLFHPLQSYRYPTANLSSSYIPTYKTQASQSESSLQARQNTVRRPLNFNQVYAQNFSPFMMEVLRNLPRNRCLGRTGNNLHKRRLNSKPSDYWELNRRRPSVIRRSIKGGPKCSSPREAVLEPNFTPNYPQHDGSFIHKHPLLSTKDSVASPVIPNIPQSVASIIPEDTHLSTNYPQREHQRSPINQNSIQCIPNESQPENVLPPITRKRPFVSSIPYSTEHQKSPVILKKPRKSPQSTSETSSDLSPVNDKVIPDHGNLTQIENSQERDLLSADATTSPTEHSRTSPKNPNTAKPAPPKPSQNEDVQPSKKDKKFKYSCFHCNKRFLWYSHWQAHERIHTGVRPFKCNQCDRCFTRCDGLQAHMVIHSTKKPHKCSICSKLFARKSMLERHVLEHTGIIPYKCEVCQEELLEPEDIEEHLAQHKEQKRFACQYCKRSFVNGRRLVRHIRAHTGEKPFPCSQCKMRFGKKSALLIHHRVHTGIKPFSCSDCGKSFSISGNLRRHLLIHTGERPYPCTKCKKRFNNKSHLARHVSSQHGN